jgi:hypothetical protein
MSNYMAVDEPEKTIFLIGASIHRPSSECRQQCGGVIGRLRCARMDKPAHRTDCVLETEAICGRGYSKLSDGDVNVNGGQALDRR